MKKPSLIVFDLDGTLVDSRADLANAANAALSILGLPLVPKEKIISFVGDGIDALIKRCLTEKHIDLFDKARRYFDDHYGAHLLDNTVLLPEVPETLEMMRHSSRLAVLTNKSERYAREILKGLGVASFFNYIVGEQGGKVPKPDPGALRSLIKRSNITPGQALMVGDGRNDILVSRKAGCKSCAVADSGEKERQLVPYEPDFIIHKMGELPGLFDEV